jgi:hypothetical protein
MVDFLCREKDEEEVYRQYFSHCSTINAAAPEQGAHGVDRGLFKKFTALFLGEAMIWRSFVISSIFTVRLQTKTDSLMSRISGIRLI